MTFLVLCFIIFIFGPIVIPYFIAKRIKRKSLKILFLFATSGLFYFSLIRGFLFWLHPDIGYGYLLLDYDYAHGYVIEKESKNIYIEDVETYQYNNRYLIAQKIIPDTYICQKKMLKKIFTHHILYILIDMYHDTLITSVSKNEFESILKSKNIALKINKLDFDLIKKSNFYVTNNYEIQKIKLNCIYKPIVGVNGL